MNDPLPPTQAARAAVLDLLARIAPGNDLDALDPDADLRVELDLDSMDFLAFVVGLDERLGIAVPEEDYPSMTTLRGAVDYLVARLPAVP